MISILMIIITKGTNSVNTARRVTGLDSPHSLIMVNFCTKFGENILNCLRVMEQTRFQYLSFQRDIIP